MSDRIFDPDVDRLISSMGEFSPMTKEMQGPEIPDLNLT